MPAVKHIHILGICGTFMGGLALLARQAGFKVTGSDENVYPPMSTQLAGSGIALMQGFRAENLLPRPDLVIIGNALSRGNEEVEAVLNQSIPYTSGAEWLSRNILQGKWVLAVSGTHGKTTTASMLAWILQYAKMQPGFLIGGVPENFGISAKGSNSDFFVIEADEYDTAFFDKRSKFVHYHPRTLLINNLEYDHADIFADLEQIKIQFHHLLRTVPGEGKILYPPADKNIVDTLNMGCWSHTEQIGNEKGWQAKLLEADASSFAVLLNSENLGTVKWDLLGEHNAANALGAIAAARHAGVPTEHAISALNEFKGVKRRMQLRGVVNEISVYDDFAHHPTAIATTLDGLRKKVGGQRIIAILEPRSNTMKLGVHNKTLLKALDKADVVYIFVPGELKLDLSRPGATKFTEYKIFSAIEDLLTAVRKTAKAGDHLLIMSNGGFFNIHEKLLKLLDE